VSGSIVPNKALGQNFLISDRVCRRILRLSEIEPNDIVLEIGSGTGFLTNHLLKIASRVIAIETDGELIEQLKRRWPETPRQRLRLVHGDVLDFPLANILPRQPVKIVGNLPYNISTSIIRRMKSFGDRFHNATFMLQKEVAQRILAQPGAREFGYFTVWSALHFEKKAGFDVARGCFRPIPKVESSVIQLIPIPDTDVCEAFDCFLKQAFQQPRKTLHNNLKSYFQEVETALSEVGIPTRARPHQVSPQMFRSLWNLFK